MVISRGEKVHRSSLHGSMRPRSASFAFVVVGEVHSSIGHYWDHTHFTGVSNSVRVHN